jgi:hypothetical protein
MSTIDDDSVAAGDAKANEEVDVEEGVVGIGKGIDLRCSVAYEWLFVPMV